MGVGWGVAMCRRGDRVLRAATAATWLRPGHGGCGCTYLTYALRQTSPFGSPRQTDFKPGFP